MKIIKKQELLMNSLHNFYSQNEGIHFKSLLSIINGENNISLRIIDWFVTNYSKKNNISWINNNNRFVVYLNYKAQLKAYSKKQFDPFCRRERLNFYLDDSVYIITTVGQLNFFKWILNNNILNYILLNLPKIEQDMHESLKNAYNKSTAKRKKRKELSTSATKSMHKQNVQIILKF
tara:strand:- start:435 stop:965 length:531 start_codon:yes stop_codon:yes gene_type:complete